MTGLVIKSLELMVSVFLKATDTLQKSPRQPLDIIDDILTPIHYELKDVVKDYYALLARSRELAEVAGVDELAVSLRELRGLRTKHLDLRQALEGFIITIDEKVKSRRVKDFLRKVERVLFASGSHSEGRKLSKSGELITVWEYLERGDISRGEVLDYLARMEREIGDAWVAVNQSYSQMQIDMWKKRGRRRS